MSDDESSSLGARYPQHRPIRPERNQSPERPHQDRLGTEFDSVMQALSKSGFKVSETTFSLDNNDVLSLRTPSDTLWNSTLEGFYSRVGANTDSQKYECFKCLLSDLILNTTSDKRDYTRCISWPTGTFESIRNVFPVPQGFTMRNFLSHRQAQLFATAIMTAPNNREFVEAVRAKNKYSRNYSPSIMYDFVDPTTNEFARTEQSTLLKARDVKTYGTRSEEVGAYRRVSRNVGNEGNEAKERYHDSLY